jgi:hypothetical protein
LIRKPKGKRPLEISRHRCEDNIRMDIMEMGWEDLDCIFLIQHRGQWLDLVKTIMNPWVPQKIGNYRLYK